jgi:hypothetical protein
MESGTALTVHTLEVEALITDYAATGATGAGAPWAAEYGNQVPASKSYNLQFFVERRNSRKDKRMRRTVSGYAASIASAAAGN